MQADPRLVVATALDPRDPHSPRAQRSSRRVLEALQPVTVATEAIVVVLPEAHARELARRIDGKPPIVLANGGAR